MYFFLVIGTAFVGHVLLELQTFNLLVLTKNTMIKLFIVFKWVSNFYYFLCCNEDFKESFIQ